MTTKLLLFIACLSAAAWAVPSPTVVDNGLGKWKNSDSEFGRWISTNCRIAIIEGKYQPQFWVTNQWMALFEGDASFNDLDMAKFKLKRALEVEKAVQDGLAMAFGRLNKALETPKATNAIRQPTYTNQPSAWNLELSPGGSYIILTNPPGTDSWIFTNALTITTNWWWQPDKLIESAKEHGQLTNLVNLLVSSGDFCRIHGHAWKFGGNFSGSNFKVPIFTEPLSVEERTCQICGKVESRAMPAWPEP